MFVVPEVRIGQNIQSGLLLVTDLGANPVAIGIRELLLAECGDDVAVAQVVLEPAGSWVRADE